MSRRETIITVALLVALFGAAGWILLAHLGLTSAEQAFARKFEQVQIGAVESEVVALLGEPDERTSQFRLGQYAGNEPKYAGAQRSGYRSCLLWKGGGHVIYAVAFDEQSRVCFAAAGGT